MQFFKLIISYVTWTHVRFSDMVPYSKFRATNSAKESKNRVIWTHLTIFSRKALVPSAYLAKFRNAM